MKLRQYKTLYSWWITYQSAGRRQKKKSRRRAEAFSRAYYFSAALIFRAAVSFCLSETYDDPKPCKRHGGFRREPPWAINCIDKFLHSLTYQKKPDHRRGHFYPWIWTVKSSEYFLLYLCACPGFSDRRILLFQKFFEKVCSPVGKIFRASVEGLRKGRNKPAPTGYERGWEYGT